MYDCLSMCACVYVRPHVNACNPICMYFTHAHINLLFIKQVLFISAFQALFFLAQPSSSRSFSRKTRFLLPNSCFGYPVADIMSCRGLCSCDDGWFFCNTPPTHTANLHMYMCRLDEKSLHTWAGRVIEATKIACVCVCVY